MRLFISIKLSKKMKDSLMDMQESMRRFGVRGNYTKPENMHLTLAFIGEFKDPEYVRDIIDTIDFEPFMLKLSGMGAFRNLWWAGTEKSDELTKLARSLRHRLSQAAIPFDRKKFRPHITLIRKPDRSFEAFQCSFAAGTVGSKRRSGDAKAARVTNASMKVDHISLMRSDRGKHGMIYTEL